MIVTLERYAYMPSVTLGRLQIGTFDCYTLERPWMQNEPFESCIPEGFYIATRKHSQTHGLTYEIDVPGRTHILFHPANWVYQLKGCIAPGQYVDPKHFNENNHHGAMVSHSREAFDNFISAAEGLNSFKLHVTQYRPKFD